MIIAVGRIPGVVTTIAFLILNDDTAVFEKYFDGHTADSISMTSPVDPSLRIHFLVRPFRQRAVKSVASSPKRPVASRALADTVNERIPLRRHRWLYAPKPQTIPSGAANGDSAG